MDSFLRKFVNLGLQLHGKNKPIAGISMNFQKFFRAAILSNTSELIFKNQ